jgi:hypothetical protein
VSLERLATFFLSIPEGVVERRTAVHPVRAFTSIGHDCVGCYIVTWNGDCLGSSSRGQPRGALPLHQVTQRQFIKFADPTRRSGHNKLLHVLPRREHINLRRTFSNPGCGKKNKPADKEPEEDDQGDKSNNAKFQDASKTINVIFGGDEEFNSRRGQKTAPLRNHVRRAGGTTPTPVVGGPHLIFT